MSRRLEHEGARSAALPTHLASMAVVRSMVAHSASV